MFKPVTILAALLFALSLTADAQTDTSHYDLGRLSVKKDFIQSITIKGNDLQRLQFSDLSDAINIWLYGTYTNSSSVVYVVDGNIINDVNAYSIYDIDEITLVQNAAVQVSGASPVQQMVLIKLRSGRPGKQGVEAAGQTNLITLRNQDNTSGQKSTRNFYHQYYLSGYKNFNNAHLAVSADYQRDVFPQLKGDNYHTLNPFNFNRFKLNAYGDAKVWKGSTVNFGINYAPQTSRYAANFSSPVMIQDEQQIIDNKTHVTQHLINLSLALNSQLAKGLTNTLSGAYNHYNYFETDTSTYQFINSSNSADNEFIRTSARSKTSNLLIRDNLVYHTKLGTWDFEPSVNFSYRNVHDSLGVQTFMIQGATGIPGGNVYSTQEYSIAGAYKTYMLTPSVNFYYNDIVNIQGGLVSFLNAEKDFFPGYPKHRLFPYLTTSIDIAKLLVINNISLRIFGSFAKQNQLLADDNVFLAGFEVVGNTPATGPPVFGFNTNSTTSAQIYNYSNPYQEFNNYNAGVLLGLFKNFTVNYSFQLNYYVGQYVTYIPSGINGFQFEEFPYSNKTITNRIGFDYNYNSGTFKWRTGLNFAESKLQALDNTYLATQYNSGYLGNGHRWSGGFTNRFNYNNFFAGIDILYQLGERPLTLMYAIPGVPGYIAPSHNNSISLQNLYAGTQLKITQLKYAEVFINCRNILQNKSADITDNRRFVGLGFKAGL